MELLVVMLLLVVIVLLIILLVTFLRAPAAPICDSWDNAWIAELWNSRERLRLLMHPDGMDNPEMFFKAVKKSYEGKEDTLKHKKDT